MWRFILLGRVEVFRADFLYFRLLFVYLLGFWVGWRYGVRVGVRGYLVWRGEGEY